VLLGSHYGYAPGGLCKGDLTGVVVHTLRLMGHFFHLT